MSGFAHRVSLLEDPVVAKLVSPIWLFVLFPACGVVGTSQVVAPAQDVAAGPKAALEGAATDVKKQSAAIALTIAEKRLEQTRLQGEADHASKERDVEFAATELEFAKAKLEQFKAIEMPNRIAEAQLDLQRVRDSAKERADELAQIEAMYSEQKIDDKTKEFVLERGRRQAEAGAKQVEIAVRRHELATQHEIPREFARLQLDLAKKTSELEKARIGLQTSRIEREIKQLSAEGELTKARNELEQASTAK
jgi:hypothetical protein